MITTAHAHKSGVIIHNYFPRPFKQQQQKKTKLRPKMTKIASRSCLKIMSNFFFCHFSVHYDAQGILQRCEQVLDRRQALKERSVERRSLLEESLQLQRFERDVAEAEAWCNEKSQIASDESYRDPTNLQVRPL